jgi:hypothetical protein
MTSSYQVLTAPGGADIAHQKTLIIRDGFTWLGFLFPCLWLAAYRLWPHAVAAFLLQFLGGALVDRPEVWPIGAAITFGTSLLVALEGENLRIHSLVSQGWEEDALVSADSLQGAEEIYFSGVQTDLPAESRVPSPQWDSASHADARRGNATSLGLFGFDGGR